MTNKKDLVIAELNSMDTYAQFDELCSLWNEYASEEDVDSMIYDSIEDLQDLCGFEPLELVRIVFFGNVQNWDDKVALNGYANLVSVCNAENSPIRLDDLAEWLIDTDHEFLEKIDFDEEETEE